MYLLDFYLNDFSFILATALPPGYNSLLKTQKKHIYFTAFFTEETASGTQREIDRDVDRLHWQAKKERRKFIVTLCVGNHTELQQCVKYAGPYATAEMLRAKTVNCCFGCILSSTIFIPCSIDSLFTTFYDVCGSASTCYLLWTAKAVKSPLRTDLQVRRCQDI